MSSSSWFISPVPLPEAKLRLFAFPYAGGGVPVYRRWAQALAPHIEFHVLQLPGRGARLEQQPFTRMSDLLEAVFSEFQALTDRPCAFFGYSMGGLVSFELARRWRRESGALPRHFFVAACQAPQLFHLRHKKREVPVHQLSEPDFLDYLKSMDFAPAETLLNHPTLRELFLPTVRADLEIGETYVYQAEAPLACPITTFGGDRDPLVSIEELSAWREQSAVGFRQVMLERKHDFLESDREFLLGEVLKDLSPYLSL